VFAFLVAVAARPGRAGVTRLSPQLLRAASRAHRGRRDQRAGLRRLLGGLPE